jgi:hypothetical protein
MGLDSEKVDGFAGSLFANVFAFGIGEAGKGVANVDAADVGGRALGSVSMEAHEGKVDVWSKM